MREKVTRGIASVRRGERTRTRDRLSRVLEPLRFDRIALVALWLTVVLVVSVVAVPVAGAHHGPGPANGNGNGNGVGHGSSGDPASAGTGSWGSTTSSSSNSNAGGNGNSAETGGNSGASDRGANDRGANDSEASSNGDGAGRPDETGQPETAQASGQGAASEPGSPEGAPADGSRGNGPLVDVSVKGPDASGVGRPDEPSSGPTAASGAKRVVNVSVGNVSAGERVSLDVSPPSVEGDEVAFDGFTATVTRDGDFSLGITSSRDRLPGSPTFDPDDGAESLGRIRLDHTITNDEVEDVTYDFRVSKARLRTTATDPESVALYRYEDGSWTALPTELVGETETHYLLSADSPGMSEFAVGAKRPVFEAWWASVEDADVAIGESTTVSGRVTNTGGADGVFEAELVVDGVVVDRRRVTVAAGGTRQVNFETSFAEPGTHRVGINGVLAGDVTVRSDAAEESVANFPQPIDIAFKLAVGLGRVFGIAPISFG